MRRPRLTVTTAAALALLLAACGGGEDAETEQTDTEQTDTEDSGEESTEETATDEFEGDTLTINSFGGDYEETHQQAVIEPFEEEYGVTVEVQTAYSADAMAQLTAQADNPVYDVVHFSGGQETAAANDDMLEPVSEDDLEHAADLHPVALEGLERGEGPVMSIAPMGIIFRTDVDAEAPTSWADVTDDQYAEHVALTDFSNAYGMLTFLAINEALGGSLDDIQPGLDELGAMVEDDDAIVVETSPDIQQGFAQRDIWLAPYAQDYAQTLIDAGIPVEFIMPEEGSPGSFITANVVAGTGNEELAKAFVDYQLRPEVQQAWAEALRYSPTNTTVELEGEVAETVAFGDDIDELVRYDAEKIEESSDDWADQWNERITQ